MFPTADWQLKAEVSVSSSVACSISQFRSQERRRMTYNQVCVPAANELESKTCSKQRQAGSPSTKFIDPDAWPDVSRYLND